ncbi:MFS transporter [Chitinivorax sp. B]|uniref:MFS transporter n=1 Tax=Chitinivorax sp. B TaxID=2502235 RepID=UPI001485A1A4|nr:MFS transporter [Chitinivorax sp. B]
MPSLMEVIRDRSFIRIWLAIFVSTTGNFLLMLSLSVYVYQHTTSNFAAAAVFATQWLAAIFSAPLVNVLSSRLSSRRLSAYSEWVGGAISLLIGLSYGWLPAVYLWLFGRGLAESISKSARVVALKEHVPDRFIEKAASLVGTATFLGISIGSLIGAALVGKLTMLGITLADALTFLISGALYCSLSPLHAETAARPTGGRASIWQVFSVVQQSPDMTRHFAYVVMTTAFFQGYHNIARTLLPVSHLQMGPQGVMYLQAIASAAFFVGAMFVALLMQQNNRAGKAEPWVMCLWAAMAMLGSVLLQWTIPSLLVYAVYLFLFEMAFTFSQKNLITACPKENMAVVSSIGISASTLGIVVVIYLGGWLSDVMGLLSTTLVMFGAIVVSMVLIELRFMQGKRIQMFNRMGEEQK